ncbi:DUF192 domain-containing protein [Chloroflexota bacterium]
MAAQIRFTIGDKEWQASLVGTSWELSRGLGGIAELPQNTGMLFDVGYERYVQVTTEPMLFPIDIAFLGDDLRVTEVCRNIGPGYLVMSEQPARYFFEVNAGELEDVMPGDTAFINYLSTEQTPLVIDSGVSTVISIAALFMVGGLIAGLTKNFALGAV